MSGLQRATFHLLQKLDIHMLTYVGDILRVTRGKPGIEALGVVLLLLVALGVPFLWGKCCGGTEADWAGYHLDLHEPYWHQPKARKVVTLLVPECAPRESCKTGRHAVGAWSHAFCLCSP